MKKKILKAFWTIGKVLLTPVAGTVALLGICIFLIAYTIDESLVDDFLK